MGLGGMWKPAGPYPLTRARLLIYSCLVHVPALSQVGPHAAQHPPVHMEGPWPHPGGSENVLERGVSTVPLTHEALPGGRRTWVCLMFQDLRIEVIFCGDRISHPLSCQVPDNTQ